MRVRAFAKINRSLRVIGVRADGYHELRTVFQSIALHDTLTIDERRGPFRLTCDDPDCPSDETNFVSRAALLAWRASGRRGAPRGISIHIAKRIPMQAGLGGGSSDGAAAFRAFGKLWGVDRAMVGQLAVTLGADVPYFLGGGTMVGVDRGDRLSRLPDARRAWVVLVIPPFGVSTKEAFGWWDGEKLDGARRLHPSTTARGALSRVEGQPSARRFAVRDRGNDLEPVVARRHPEIAQIVTALKKLGAREAAMSGSGSAVFGLFGRENAALDAAALLAPGTRALVTRTLDRAAYQRLARP